MTSTSSVPDLAGAATAATAATGESQGDVPFPDTPAPADPALRTTGPRTDDDYVQLLTPEGERVKPAGYEDVEFSAEEVRGFYRDLVLVRRIDTEGTALQRQGELGIWASLLGQEAAQIGSGRALRPGDFVFPTYREHGVAWCRGIDPVALLGLFRGVSHGDWDPHEHGFNLYTIVIGAQTLHATGYAMGMMRDGAEDAVVAYFGDGASAQGDVNEALIWAGVFNAPMVFFCQNNQWAISVPLERQTRAPLYKRAEGFGFPGVRVDGNDVLAVHAVTSRALQHAREGNGPTLIEAYTYRMGAHTTTDDPTRYRIASEVEEWRLKDPIERVHAYLARSGIADQEFFDAVDAEADALAAQIRQACVDLPDPDPTRIFEGVYAEPDPVVDAQRAEFATYLAGFADGRH